MQYLAQEAQEQVTQERWLWLLLFPLSYDPKPPTWTEDSQTWIDKHVNVENRKDMK